MNSTQPQEFAEQFINLTNRSIFLTGKAGTGKTTFLKEIVKSTYKQTAIVAPTGIAALNAGGVTIHSFFQLPFGGFIPDFSNDIISTGTIQIENKTTLLRHFRHNKKRQQILRSLELLIIDEVSMLRADMLDAIDWSLRNVRRINEPFGGVQVLFIGDLHQLPPVVKQEEWTYLSKYYSGIYFFNAMVLQEQAPLYVELTKIYRQQDDAFIEVLNKLRTNQLDEKGLAIINEKVIRDFDATQHKGYVTLTTHNHKATVMNQRELDKLPGKAYLYSADVTGEFPQHIFPIDPELQLKKGAQVMFTKNDLSFEKLFYNGKMATITEINELDIVVECVEDKKRIEVTRYEWENIKYSTNPSTGEIEEQVMGTFVQYPIKLAWAITIHKSQGLTFDKAVLDVSEVFAPGQAYVALSRLRSLEGLVMLNPMKVTGISTDSSIIHYGENATSIEQLSEILPNAIKQKLHQQLIKTYDWLEMASKWSALENDCQKQTTKSVKGELYNWIKAQNYSIQGTLESSRKFRTQLENLFYSTNYSTEKIVERVRASVNYFFPILDGVYTSLIKKMLEYNRVKKGKALVEELQELEELLLETILTIKKTEVIVEHIALGKKIDKETSFGNDIRNYKIARVAKVKHALINNNELFIATNQDDMEDSLFFKKVATNKKSGSKEKKKSTYETTLELVESDASIEDIARRRQLSIKTIYGHLAQLVKNEKIPITKVMDEETISYLKRSIGTQSLTLTEMKGKVNDDITFEQLKIYQAHLLL